MGSGAWISEYDMVENKNGKTIDLKRQTSQGECEIECNTIAEACQSVLREAEIDLAAQLYKSFKAKKPFDVKALTSRLCTSDDAWAANMDGGCAAGVPKVPKSRKPGPAWKQKSSSTPPPPPPSSSDSPGEAEL